MRHGNVVIPHAILQVADETIHSEDRLVIKAYGFIPVTEYFMRDFIKKLMAKYNRPELSTPIAMIIKELAVNATKANFKRVIFNENNLNLSDPSDYEKGMQIFRAAISDRMSVEYGKKAKQARLNIQAVFDFDPSRVIIEIRNNLGMTPQEEQRVRNKLRDAMHCEDIAEFMVENMDEVEGAGLGLVLSLMALKTSGIDPHLLSVTTDYENYTRARVEIPIDINYLPDRHRYQRVSAAGA